MQCANFYENSFISVDQMMIPKSCKLYAYRISPNMMVLYTTFSTPDQKESQWDLWRTNILTRYDEASGRDFRADHHSNGNIEIEGMLQIRPFYIQLVGRGNCIITPTLHNQECSFWMPWHKQKTENPVAFLQLFLSPSSYPNCPFPLFPPVPLPKLLDWK